MKLNNRTAYDTRQLRAILVAVHNEEAKTRGRLATWDKLVVTIARRHKGSYTTGRAWPARGRKIHLTIPSGTCTTAAFVALWIHELQHLYGIEHRDMSDAVRNCREEHLERYIAVGWRVAETGVLQEKLEVKRALSPEEKAARLDLRREKKLDSIVERITSWERKKRRAENALAKLRQQHKYYEGKLAAKRGE